MALIRFFLVQGGIIASVIMSVFIFKVFAGTTFPGLGHFEGSSTWLGFYCALYAFLQQQSVASRNAASIMPALLDIGSSMLAVLVLVIFGWLRLFFGLYHPTTYQWWALIMFSLVTFADGGYNSYISIRYFPRYLELNK